MGGDKQVQKAGDSSTQYQAGNMTIVNVNGVSEDRAKEIFAEQTQLARKEYTEDAYRIADERVSKFEERFMPKITQVEEALSAFADPAFQVLLRRAQLTAAATEREVDYDLLTELLVYHVQQGEDRKKRAAIKRSVEIIDDIDNGALCGLTAAYALLSFLPATGNLIDGVRLLNTLFSRLLYQDLPIGSDWLDHLDVLGVVRIMPFSSVKKIAEHYLSSLGGYICVGINENSEDYNKAIKILENAKINRDLLVPNECLNGFYRLAVSSIDDIGHLVFSNGVVRYPINDEQKNALNQIWKMYSTDAELKKHAVNTFMKIWNSFDALAKLNRWWDSIPQAFTITQVGRILAQANAKRCDSTLPDVI